MKQRTFVGCRPYYRRRSENGLTRVFFILPDGSRHWIECDDATQRLFQRRKSYTIELSQL